MTTEATENLPWEIGKNYFFRTVTHIEIGQVSDLFNVEGTVFIKMVNCSWIPDTGRYHLCLKEGM